MKQQFVVIHTIPRTKIPVLLDSSLTNTPSVKMLCQKKKCFSYLTFRGPCIMMYSYNKTNEMY